MQITKNREFRSGKRGVSRRGITLIEMLFVGLISTVLGLGLWTLLRSSYDSNTILMDQNNANANSRAALDTLVDLLRGSSGLTAAAANDITFTNTSSTYRYWLTGTTLKKTVNSLPNGGTTVATGVQSLSFTYYTYSSGSWTSSSTPGTPANVGAVKVTDQLSVSATSRQMSSLVRIRMK